MSRYSHKIVKKGKTYTVAYGYDRPLSEYFLQVFDESKEKDDDGCILWLGSYMTHTPNSEMLDNYIEWGVKKDHADMLALDLPF